MSYVDDADAGMSSVTVQTGESLALWLRGLVEFQARCPEQMHGLVSAVAEVNARFESLGESSLLVLVPC